LASAADEVAGVVARLDGIVEWAIRTRQRIGYFAAVYRRVTATVEEDIRRGRFDDGERMARLDVVFAQRFLDAIESWRAEVPPTRAWAVAFGASDRRDLTVLQQILLGINAHIRLDLAIAAATVAPGNEIASLQGDFSSINTVLAGLVRHDRLAVDSVSPVLRRLDRAGGMTDRVTDLWIDEVREHAWRVARRLAPLEGDALTTAITEIDQDVASHAEHIVRPGAAFRWVESEITSHEDHDVADVIRMLR
jgi:hypothetical protein